MSDIMVTLSDKMDKTKSVLRENLNTVRAGRANPALLDKVMVDYYDVPTPLKSLSNVSAPDPRTLQVTPFDPQTLKDIEKALHIANLGINPANDGQCIRLAIPAVTEEKRIELTKDIKKMGEEAKVAIRNLRREANDFLKKAEKAGDLTEDDLKKDLDEVQKSIDASIEDIDGIIAKKEEEIMEV